MKKAMTNEQIEMIDKINEAEAYVEFLENALAGHLSTETRDKYRSRLSTARKKLEKLNTKFEEMLNEEV